MFENDFTILFAVSLLVAVGCAIVMLWERKKIQPAFAKQHIDPLHIVKATGAEFPPALIDPPLLELSDGAEITIDKDLAVIEAQFTQIDDQESALLKAAEIVVEKVQNTLNHIASSPPNPEEVKSKIQAIIHPYTIFRDTEYFDAINSFIAVSVERDCGISLNKEELLILWE